jgi:hypothetical protein
MKKYAGFTIAVFGLHCLSSRAFANQEKSTSRSNFPWIQQRMDRDF